MLCRVCFFSSFLPEASFFPDFTALLFVIFVSLAWIVAPWGAVSHDVGYKSDSGGTSGPDQARCGM